MCWNMPAFGGHILFRGYSMKNKLLSFLIILIILALIGGTAFYFLRGGFGKGNPDQWRKGVLDREGSAAEEEAARLAAEEAERLKKEQQDKERIEKERQERTEALKKAHREMVSEVFTDWRAWEEALSLKDISEAVNHGNVNYEFRLNLTGFIEQIKTLGFDGTCKRDMENKRFALDAKLSAQNVIIASPKLTAGENTAYVKIPELLGDIMLKLPLKGMGASIMNSAVGPVLTEAVPQAESALKLLSLEPYNELAFADTLSKLDTTAYEKAFSAMAEGLSVSDWEIPRGVNGEWEITYPKEALAQLFSALHQTKDEIPLYAFESDPVFVITVDEEGVLRKIASEEAAASYEGKTVPLTLELAFLGKQEPASEFSLILRTEDPAAETPLNLSISGELDREDLSFEVTVDSTERSSYIKGNVEDPEPGKSFTADIKQLKTKDADGAEKELSGKITFALSDTPVSINSSGALDLNTLSVMDGLKLAQELSKHLEGWKRIAGYMGK